ncbi:MAG: GNAT family N-acetyltransferase [Bacteroidota bacterium]
MTITRIDNSKQLDKHIGTDSFIDFLHTHLDQFGDPKPAIMNCIDFAFKKNGGLGGFLLSAEIEGELVGALIMNRTGMKGYIPENILVYVAVDASRRGQGLGRSIVERALEEADGDVKLHVEYENPAKKLYERIGFTTKYAEMRWKR